MFFQVILPVLFVICAAIFGKTVLRYLYLARKIEGPSLWKLVTVHAKHFLSDDFLLHVCKLTAKYKYKPWRLWRGSRLMVFVSDPDTVGEVLKSKHLLNKYEDLYDEVGNFLGRGSLVTNGLEWKRHRNVITPAFHKDLLEAQLDVINEEAIYLVKALKNKSNESGFDISKLIGERVLSTAVRSLGNRDLVVKNVPDFYWAITEATSIVQMKVMNPIYFYFVYLFQKKNRDKMAKLQNIVDESRKIILNEKHRILQRFSEEGNTPLVPLEFLLVANSRKNKPDYLSEAELLDEALTLIAAASETTSTAIFAVLLLLALNQDVQSTLVKEIETVFDPTDNRHVTAEDLNQLEYLDMVIKEALRLFPPGPILLRSVGEECDLNGTIVPKGSVVAVNVMSLQRNPEVYQDALKFDPERFSPNAGQSHHPYGYIPFSFGARNCVGKRHAILVMKTFLCTLLRKNRILPGEKLKSIDDIKTRLRFTLHLCGASVKVVPVVSER